MELRDFLGYRLSDVQPYLVKNHINYTIVELKDRKNTRMGDELRIVKMEDKGEIIIYVTYF